MKDMTLPNKVHFIVIPHAAWGHGRPLLHLSANILLQHPNLHLSLLVSPSAKSTIDHELEILANLDEDSSHIDARLQVIPVTSKTVELEAKMDLMRMADEAADYAACLPEFIRTLFVNDGRHDKFKGLEPKFAIFDLLNGFVPDVMTDVCQSIGHPVLPLIAFCPSNAACAYHFFNPTNEGLLYPLRVQVAKDLAEGKDKLESYAYHEFECTGKVVSIPGMPDMFDYEYLPMMGSFPCPPQLYAQVDGMYDAVYHPGTTAVILPTPREFEMECHAAFEKLIKKPVIMAGVQFPTSAWIKQSSSSLTTQIQSPDDIKVISYLDNMLEKHGRNSVTYVSFGSLWYPALRPELVTYLIESLLEAKMPFIFAYASQLAVLPDELAKKIEGWEDGCVIKFAPQWKVLNHAATGIFLSHCGSNSSAEAMLAEVAIVSMPFAADQAEFTAHFVQKGAAIDLKQVKTFPKPGLGPPPFNSLYDGTVIVGDVDAIKNEMSDVWARVRGEEGERMRLAMKGLRDVAEASWRDGESKKSMEGLSKYF